MNISPNPNKNLTIEIENELFYRYPIKTHLITKDDDIIVTVRKYVKDIVRHDDLIVISKKILAITQNRAFDINEIHPSKLAKFLSYFVRKTPYGTGLSAPEAMQLAIDDAGKIKILFAAVLSALTRPFNMRGVFYRVAGNDISSIDAPAPSAIPPYNKFCIKAPKMPGKAAQNISNVFGCQAAIIDACDLGVEVLGASKGVNKEIVKKIFADNPLGQSDEQTPIAIVRRERPGEDL